MVQYNFIYKILNLFKSKLSNYLLEMKLYRKHGANLFLLLNKLCAKHCMLRKTFHESFPRNIYIYIYIKDVFINTYFVKSLSVGRVSLL